MQISDKIGCYAFWAEPFHCDFSKHLFMGHLGNHMLNAADFHANDRSFGMNDLAPINRTWVLSRLAVEMMSMPKIYDRFLVETWVESAMRYFTSRNFKVSDENGTVFGYGRSVWAMIDTQTRQPTDILALNDGLINAYVEKEKPCPMASPSRVKMTENARFVRTLEMHYGDVDVNGHVNSVKYIEHVLDLFSQEWYRSHFLKRFEIAYVAEAHGGDRLSFYMEEISDNEYCIRIVKHAKGQGEDSEELIEVARSKVQFIKNM